MPLLMGSICANYLFGKKLTPVKTDGADDRVRKIYIYVAVASNLALLGFFKYANFFVTNANAALDALQQPEISVLNIVLPIGISFFTFTQIAFLVDCWQGKVKERNFMHYLLFVTYFPHLIAGPVLHHSQMMPQFAKRETYSLNHDKIAIGIAIFTIGLAKKLLIADPVGEYADMLFDGVHGGITPMLFMSWCGVLAYTFQIYFDFSGYSDMAIGLSLFFGIHLPVNFNSPYKAASIVDFWRRWHISLSIFLREYLYIPLGGNRKGKFRRYINLLVTMLLGGLWHGANWTFMLWGAAHGVLLIINHAWHRLIGEHHNYSRIGKQLCWLMTFVSVCFTWVLFRADSLATAINIYKGMLGLNGVSLPGSLESRLAMLQPVINASFNGVWQTTANTSHYVALIISCGIILMFKNSSQIMNQSNAMQLFADQGKYTKWAGVSIGIMLAISLMSLNKVSAFLYFQF